MKFKRDTRDGIVSIDTNNTIHTSHKEFNFRKESFKEGGDADTNCAIAGALLGAVYGIGAIPSQWIDSITNCKPNEKTRKPRPQHYWPNDVLDLASQLLELPKP